MIELTQGDVEAFRFNIRKTCAPHHGRIAAFRVPSDRVLFISRYLNVAVCLLVLAFAFRAADHLRLFEALWLVQMLHLMIKFAWLWKPVRIDASRAYAVQSPRFTLVVEHTSFLMTLCVLEVVLIDHDVGSGFLWTGLAAVTVILLVLHEMCTPRSTRWR